MKSMKYVISAAVAAIVVGAVVVTPAEAGVSGTPHDLKALIDTGSTPTNQQGQTCVFCHTPHNALAQEPLWNHTQADPTDFAGTTYSSSTLTGGAAPNPGGVSLSCLGCHDGSIGLGEINTKDAALALTAAATDTMGAVPANLGTSLTNDHPVSIDYAAAITAGDDLEASPLNGIPLFGGNVECGSCHNPHDNATNGKFLRVSRANSLLCTSCHTK